MPGPVTPSRLSSLWLCPCNTGGNQWRRAAIGQDSPILLIPVKMRRGRLSSAVCSHLDNAASAESIILVRRLMPGAGPAEWVRRGNLPPSPQTILWVGSLRPSTNGSKRVWYLKHPRPLGGGSGGGGKNLFTGTHQNTIKIRHELSIVYISANTLLWKYKELMQQEIMKVAFVPMN